MTDLTELAREFRTQKRCLDFLERLRFGESVECPRCQSKSISRIDTVNKLQCNNCRYMFSVTAGTIFHRSHIPLQKWILAIFLMCNAKKGISAKQIQRDLRVTYKTAWYLMHRIRRAMRDKTFIMKFTGIVETDETYIGGKRKGKVGRGARGKTAVIGVLQRDSGRIKAEPVKDIKFKTISQVVRRYVDPKAVMVCADEYMSYDQLALEYNLKRINHQIKYVNGQIHTQGIENFWSILKRGIVGVYHKVSAQYLPLYLNEFTFRYSHNGTPDLFLQVLKNGLIYDSSLTN